MRTGSGPLLSTYLHGYQLMPRAYVFSLSVLFFVGALVQVATLAAVGLYTSARVWESLLAEGVAPVLKAVAPQCRVLIHSGCDFALPIAGVDAAALKPVPPADLVAAVRGLLRQGSTASSRS
jgi:hypothetical protein